MQLAAVVILAFVVRAMFLLRSGTRWLFNDDSDYYLALARGLAHGCGFAPLYARCGPPEIVRTPGYPLFLTPFLAHLRAAVLVQAILGAVVCLLVARFVARRHGMSAAVLAAVFVAVDVPTILVTKEIMSEALFQGLAFGAVLAALHRRGTLSGALLGAGVLVRPVGAVLIPVCVISLLTRRHWRSALGTLLMSLLIVLGWAERNDRRAGLFTVTTEGAASLYTLTAPGIIARQSGVPFRAVQDSVQLAGERQFRAVHGDTTYWGTAALPAGSRFMVAEALPIILGHPLDAAIITLEGFGEIAFAPYVLETGWKGFIRSQPVFAAVRLSATAVQCALLAVLWVGVLRATRGLRGDAHRWPFLAAGLLLILAAAPFPGNTSVRFRSPAMPFLAVLAGIGWTAPRRPRPGTT